MTVHLTALAPVSRKWCIYALLLLMPGSFIVLPALWLAKLAGVQSARK